MLPNKGLNAYRTTEVTSRTPLELVVMLYDGAIRFLGVATDAIGRGDIPARRDAVSRALAIIAELQSTLDLARGGAVAEELDQLYTYITRRIMDASMKQDAAPLDEARKLLTTLRDAWQSIAALPATAGTAGARP